LKKYSFEDSPQLDAQVNVIEDEENKDIKEYQERFTEFTDLNLEYPP
jgi:hypothetical protein